MNIEQIKEYIKKNGLDTKSRVREVVYRRTYLMNHLRDNTAWSLKTIAKLFNRDHSTMLYAINKIHKNYTAWNDEQYERATVPVKAFIEGGQFTVDLRTRVEQCKTRKDLELLKKEIKLGLL